MTRKEGGIKTRFISRIRDINFGNGWRRSSFKKTISSLWALLLAAFLASMLLTAAVPVGHIALADGSGLNSIWMDPSAINYNELNASMGTMFNVTVWANMENATFAWQTEVHFDPSLIQEVNTGYTANATSQFFAGHTTVDGGPIVDNVNGMVLSGESLLGQTDYAPQTNASLIWIEFEVVSVPNETTPSLTSTIWFNTTDTFFLDFNVNPIPTTDYGATYTFNYLPAFIISPSSETLTVNNTFTVTVNLTDVQNLFDWQVVLKYNGTALTLDDMWIPDDNVFAGHTVVQAGPTTNLRDYVDGSAAAIMGATLLDGDSIANVDNSVLCMANFTVTNLGQSLIQVAVNTNPLNEAPIGSPPVSLQDYSFWQNTNDAWIFAEENALGSNCTVSAYPLPIASFSYTLPPPETLDTVTFDASNSTTSVGTIATYTWNFGDSNITSTNTTIITHTYTSGGTYNVTLAVTNTLGLTGQTTQTLTVFNDYVAVTNIFVVHPWVYQGQIATVNVTVSNFGDFSEGAWVTLYSNEAANQSVITAYPLQLNAGQTYTLVFAWNTSSTPCLTYTLTAVATIPAGSNTLSDGTLQVRLLGDVNGDGRVDMKDIAIVARALGSTPSSPNWNPAADILGIGIVDMKDIAIVARNFGKHYP